MTCPTCHGPIVSRHDERLGCALLTCRACKRFSVPGSSQWITGGPGMLQQLIGIKEQIVEDEARMKLMMESPIEHPVWEDHSV